MAFALHVVPGMRNWKQLGQIIVEWYRVPQSSVDALSRRKADGYRLGEKLVALGMLSEGELMRALAHQLGVPIVCSIEASEVPWSVRQLVPLAVCARRNVCPIATTDDGGVVLAMADPTDFETMTQIQRASDSTVFPVIAAPHVIARAIEAFADSVAEVQRHASASGGGVFLMEPCAEDPTDVSGAGGVIPLVPFEDASTIAE